MHIVIFFLITAAFLGGFYPITAPPRQEIQIAPAATPIARIHSSVVPASQTTHDRMVKQNFDYSCGSAALATLLNYQIGENFSERQVIAGLMRYGDKEAIASRRAFSFLDMKHFVDALGYKGAGYTATLQDLKELNRACIVPVTVFNYRHFVVFKGIDRGHIFFADPFFGDTSYTLQEFEAHWYRNALFIVYPKKGETELHALRLREEDLRFIDEDAARAIMFNHDPGWPLTREWEMEKTYPHEDRAQSRQFGGIQVIQQPAPTSETP